MNKKLVNTKIEVSAYDYTGSIEDIQAVLDKLKSAGVVHIKDEYYKGYYAWTAFRYETDDEAVIRECREKVEQEQRMETERKIQARQKEQRFAQFQKLREEFGNEP